MATQYTKEFKNDAVRYWKEHPELGIGTCARNLGVSKSTLSNWKKLYDSNEGTVPTRGRGNFENYEAKEIARLRKELWDTQDALDILKKSNRHTGKMTQALFFETARQEELLKEQGGHRLNVSGVLRILGVSRSGYLRWKSSGRGLK